MKAATFHVARVPGISAFSSTDSSEKVPLRLSALLARFEVPEWRNSAPDGPMPSSVMMTESLPPLAEIASDADVACA